MTDRPWFRTVLHPTDFTAGSDVAFVHALKIATSAGGGGRFTIIHADPAGESHPRPPEFPSVRSSLERWGMLPLGSRREDVFNELGVAVGKVSVRGPNVVDAVNEHIVSHPVDLLVLATRGGEGLPQWIRPSVSERLARLSKTTTLFVPTGARGFVAPENGSAQLRHILIPIANEPDPHAAIGAACSLAEMLSGEPARIDLLHVEGHGPNPAPRLMRDGQFIPQCLVRTGDIVEQISAVALERQVDLIAMSTYGHHGFLDALRGSTSEQVVRRAACPVLAAPVTGRRRRVPLFSFAVPDPTPSTA
jgi:nucleotide-binding universal stress UspA family protein